MKIDEIDINQLKELCKMHSTCLECAAVIGCSVSLIKCKLQQEGWANFTEFSNYYSAVGKQSIRRKQFDMAINGDRTMLVWLGKQYLGQADKVEEKVKTVNVKKLDDFYDDVRSEEGDE